MKQLFWLQDKDPFPDCEFALDEPNGLLAAGGDLSSKRLLSAYYQGIFPWYTEHPILWWSPDPRLVLYPDQIHISRSLRKFMQKTAYSVTIDQAFNTVLQHCANTPREGQDGTWLNHDMQSAYRRLHNQGIAHSIEVWYGNRLAGGLYGLNLGACFFGESMFSLQTNASKVALVHLCDYLNRYKFKLIDCQVETKHLLSMGGKNIPRTDFLQQLTACRDQETGINWQYRFERG